MTPTTAGRDSKSRFFAAPFGPFFLGAGVSALLAVAAWLALIAGVGPAPGFLPASLWHGHELLFGFATASMSGFLLTAAPNWSGRPALHGIPLAVLFGIWCVGRGAMWIDIDFPRTSAVLAWLYLPALAIAAWPYLKASGRRNMVFLVLLAALSIAQAMVLWGGVHNDFMLARRGLLLGVGLFVLLITVIGGRVVPAFTRNALQREGDGIEIRASSKRDQIAMALIVATLIADQALPPAYSGWIAIAAGCAIAARLWGWGGSHTLLTPLLWVLHLGYSWVAVGFVWKGVCFVSDFGGMGAALHGLTVGAVGTMTLAVMSRAALGHSGQPLIAPRATSVGYALISLAAIARMAATLVEGSLFTAMVLASGVAWCVAFALFLFDFAPVLVGRAVKS